MYVLVLVRVRYVCVLCARTLSAVSMDGVRQGRRSESDGEERRPRLDWGGRVFLSQEAKPNERNDKQASLLFIESDSSEQALIEARDNITGEGGEKNNERKQTCVSTGVEGGKEERKHQSTRNECTGIWRI